MRLKSYTNRFRPPLRTFELVCASLSLSLSCSSYIYLTRIGVTISRATEHGDIALRFIEIATANPRLIPYALNLQAMRLSRVLCNTQRPRNNTPIALNKWAWITAVDTRCNANDVERKIMVIILFYRQKYIVAITTKRKKKEKERVILAGRYTRASLFQFCRHLFSFFFFSFSIGQSPIMQRVFPRPRANTVSLKTLAS